MQSQLVITEHFSIHSYMTIITKIYIDHLYVNKLFLKSSVIVRSSFKAS